MDEVTIERCSNGWIVSTRTGKDVYTDFVAAMRAVAGSVGFLCDIVIEAPKPKQPSASVPQEKT